MDNLVSFLSKILILSLVSLLLITSSDVIFTKHDRQENKIITSLKLLCELFIVFTTLLYIGSKSTEKTNNCHENIVLLLSIVKLEFPGIVFVILVQVFAPTDIG